MSLSQIVWFRWKSVTGDTQYWQAVAVSIQKCYITVQSHKIITQKVSFVVVWPFCGFNSPNQYQMQAIDRFSRMGKKLTYQLALDNVYLVLVLNPIESYDLIINILIFFFSDTLKSLE